MLSKKEIDFLNKLLESENVKGKKRLEDFIWINTTKPKYQVGDIVKFDNSMVRHYGIPAIDLVGVITKVRYWFDDRKIKYEINYQWKHNDDKEIHDSIAYLEERKIKCKNPLNRVNILRDKKRDEDSESIPIYL